MSRWLSGPGTRSTTLRGRQRQPAHLRRWEGDFHFDDRGSRRPGGYNFLIGLDGVIREMCGWEFVGAHAPTCNRPTIGVAFQGTYSARLPSDLQLRAFNGLVSSHQVPNRQQGHRDCSATSCAGSALHRALPLDVDQEDEMTPEQEARLDAPAADVETIKPVLGSRPEALKC